ncbi:Phosphotransferase, partial [Trichostrongylus colubriformis]
MGGSAVAKHLIRRAHVSSMIVPHPGVVKRSGLFPGYTCLQADSSTPSFPEVKKSLTSCQKLSISNPCEILIDVYKQIVNMMLGMFVARGSRLFAGVDGVDRQVEEACQCLNLSDDVLRNVMAALKDGMALGVKKGTPMGIGLKMIPSYVRAIPNGTETGDYLALDLGGTNFRVLLIRLRGSEAEMVGKIYEIPTSIQRGTGDA